MNISEKVKHLKNFSVVDAVVVTAKEHGCTGKAKNTVNWTIPNYNVHYRCLDLQIMRKVNRMNQKIQSLDDITLNKWTAI